DAPVFVDEEIVMVEIDTRPTMFIDDQVIIYADNTPNMEMMDMAPMLYAHYAVVESAGFLVIHTDNEGAPGPVAG
ncbi:MAG TPA: hypothetical protein PLZ51_15100, partial [Aggregatilineales bacterium]|nr:hypothetical protein [Aggregatilineales bacterium]